MDARAPSLPLGLEPQLEAQIEADAASIVAAAVAAAGELTDDQIAILDFERQWWRQPGAKEQAIRDSFEMSPTRYYQTLNALLDHPRAVHYDPVLVHRLLRLRAATARGRR